jgi:hypothetical protein
MYSAKVAFASAALSLWALSANAATVTPTNVMGEVGHTARVCGVVAWATYEVNFRAHPTFITMVDPDQPNALHALTAVIYGDDRAKFGGAPEASLDVTNHHHLLARRYRIGSSWHERKKQLARRAQPTWSKVSPDSLLERNEFEPSVPR